MTAMADLKALDNGLVDGMLNILVGGKTYANPTLLYDVIYSVSNGRKAAKTITTLFKSHTQNGPL